MITEKLTAAEFLANPKTVKLPDDDPNGDPEDIFHLLMGKGVLIRDLLAEDEFNKLAEHIATEYPYRFRSFIDHQITHMTWFARQTEGYRARAAEQEGQNAYPKELRQYFEKHERFAELEPDFHWV